ncbi:hypothetical protein ES703_72631 [subsurface metagenome]
MITPAAGTAITKGTPTYTEKGSVTETNLAGISNKEVQSNGSNGIDPDGNYNIENIRTAHKGNNGKEKNKSNYRSEPAKICLEDGKFLSIGFFKISAGVKLQVSHFSNPFN